MNKEFNDLKKKEEKAQSGFTKGVKATLAGIITILSAFLAREIIPNLPWIVGQYAVLIPPALAIIGGATTIGGIVTRIVKKNQLKEIKSEEKDLVNNLEADQEKLSEAYDSLKREYEAKTSTPKYNYDKSKSRTNDIPDDLEDIPVYTNSSKKHSK